MEYKQCETNNEPQIIVINDAQETITTKGNLKKPKTKKHHKRKVKLGKNHNNNSETLYITQKLNMKKTKFNCIININNICEKKKKRRRSSIIRFARNECKREAYYNRIVPICMRHNCFSGDSKMKCCRTVGNKEYRIKKAELKVAIKRSGILSPVSSVPLSDTINVSYEDVSDNSFSSVDELDTLIKRTKQRENQFIFSMKAYSAPLSSTPIPMSEEVASTYSGGSLHSTSTLVLPPLGAEAYSPTTSPGYMCNASGPYSPATPDWITFGNIDFRPIESPYSPSDPTNTLIINGDEKRKDCKTGNGVKAGQYSLASPPHIDNYEEYKNKNHDKHIIDNKLSDRVDKTKNNGTNHMIKVEDIKREESEIEDYHNNGEIFKSEINENNNVLIRTDKIKRENENGDINDNFECFVKVEKPWS